MLAEPGQLEQLGQLEGGLCWGAAGGKGAFQVFEGRLVRISSETTLRQDPLHRGIGVDDGQPGVALGPELVEGGEGGEGHCTCRPPARINGVPVRVITHTKEEENQAGAHDGSRHNHRGGPRMEQR